MTLPPLPEPALVMTITPDMGANFTTPRDRGATLYPGDVFHCYKPSAVQLLLAAERERCQASERALFQMQESAKQLAQELLRVRLDERERCAQQLDALGCDHCAAAIRNGVAP